MVLTRPPYPVPDAGDYNAPTPHASVAAQEIFRAPSSEGAPPSGGSGGAGLAALDGLGLPSEVETPGTPGV